MWPSPGLRKPSETRSAMEKNCTEYNAKHKPHNWKKLITQALFYSKDMETFASGLKKNKTFCNEAGVKNEFQNVPYVLQIWSGVNKGGAVYRTVRTVLREVGWQTNCQPPTRYIWFSFTDGSKTVVSWRCLCRRPLLKLHSQDYAKNMNSGTRRQIIHYCSAFPQFFDVYSVDMCVFCSKYEYQNTIKKGEVLNLIQNQNFSLPEQRTLEVVMNKRTTALTTEQYR